MQKSYWSDDAYSHLQKDHATKSTQQLFPNQTVAGDMSPKNVKFRESRDSSLFPQSEAIAVFMDETGSMGSIPEALCRQKLGTLMNTLHQHKVPQAQVLFGGIGDHYSDNFPLQVGQFETGTEELNKWLTAIVLEGKGGGQDMESYSLAWLFAARHTSIDCFEKRGEKGFLFTIGDEFVHPVLEKDFLTSLLGYDFPEDISAESILAEAQRMYHVFHLHIHQTPTGSSPVIIEKWQKLLGERVLIVEDYNNVAEIMASTVAVIRGADLKNVLAGFDDHTAQQVSNALVKINRDLTTEKQQEGIVTL